MPCKGRVRIDLPVFTLPYLLHTRNDKSYESLGKQKSLWYQLSGRNLISVASSLTLEEILYKKKTRMKTTT